MKKLLLPFILLLVLIISACSNEYNNKREQLTRSEEKKSETITYQSENGPIEVPADPQRVVVLSAFAGNVMALDVNLVGVDSWSKMNPRFEKELKDVEEVSDESLEKIIELEPDLIIGLSNIKNVDKLNEIAPTVTYTYGKVDYLTQHLEIGKLLNKEKEAQAWVDDFKKTCSKPLEKKLKQKLAKMQRFPLLKALANSFMYLAITGDVEQKSLSRNEIKNA